MLLHIEETLPSTIHLPVSLEDTLHFNKYLCTNILIADEKFLLLIDVPIQDCAQQFGIYEVFNLVIPHRSFSTHYIITNRYLGITYDDTKAVEILKEQFSTCQKANGLFCSLNTPLQPLVNPPMCIPALHAKDKAGIKKRCSLQIRKASCVNIPTPIAPNVWILTSAPTTVSMEITLIHPEEAPQFLKTQMPIHILQLPPACSTTSQHFHLLPCYETNGPMINTSFNTVNLNGINISSPEFRI